MSHFPARIPKWIEWVYPQRIWRMQDSGNQLYLSFDDGPHPEITPMVLEMLKQYDAKATFFCIGDRVARYPHVFNAIREAGHAVGNHTHHHLNGWKTSDEHYLQDVQKAQALIGTDLFRPPYGRLKSSQAKALNALGMKVVMWTVLSADYDKSLSPKSCTTRVLGNMRGGDIHLFHDSEKASGNMFYALERLLEEGRKKEVRFCSMA